MMMIPMEDYMIQGKSVILRSPNVSDAQMLIDYMQTVMGETRFLSSEPDEIQITKEQEERYIERMHASKDALMIMAFVDGEYAGNCSFERLSGSRRKRHRAEIGIALFQKYTGLGLGRLMLLRLIAELHRLGYEQVELTVLSGNERAYHLYESLGFQECGRIPNANKYDDGTYADNILMVLQL